MKILSSALFGVLVLSHSPAPDCSAAYACSLHQTNAELTTIPLPPVPFSGLTGAGQCVTVQPYNTTVCRCTDTNTDPTNTEMHSFEVTDSGGDNVFQWNVDQTRLRVVRMSTGSTAIVNVSQNQCSPTISGSQAPAGPVWSATNPDVDYIQSGMTAVKKRIFSGANPPITSSFFDFASCPLMTGLAVSYNTQLTTNDDDVFLMVFGVNGQNQDSAQYAIAFKVSTGACALLNTLTGQVSAFFGMGTLTGSVSTFYPFTIHSGYLGPGGQFIIGVGDTCTGCPKHGPFIWYPATNRMDMIAAQIGGHQTSGYSTFLNVASAPKIAARKFSDLGTVTYLNSSVNVHFPTPQSIHMGWQNDDSSDLAPVCMSEASQGLPQPIQITSPLQQEVFCVDPTSGVFIRLTPTFSSGIANPDNFRTREAIMANGKRSFIAFSSDMEGTLGNADGVTSACTLGAARPNECRSDVFIVVPK